MSEMTLADAAEILKRRLSQAIKLPNAADYPAESQEAVREMFARASSLEDLLGIMEDLITEGNPGRFSAVAVIDAFEAMCEDPRTPPEMIGVSSPAYAAVMKKITEMVTEEIAQRSSDDTKADYFTYGFLSGMATMLRLIDSQKENPNA